MCGRLPIAVIAMIMLPHLCKGGTVRPKTIVYFERIIFGTLLLVALEWYLFWNRIIPDENPADNSLTATLIAVQIFKFALIATLTLLVSRRRSKVAMWLSIALFALSLVATLASYITFGTTGISDLVILDLAVLIAKGVAYGPLFTPSAQHWMRPEDKVLEVFH
jgi:hypothetical protein